MIASLLLAYFSALAVCLTLGFPGLLSMRPPLRPQRPLASTCAPASLQARLTEISRGADGKVGAALMLVETGDMLATLDADDRFPMQSVYKLPIAMAALQLVDRGTRRWIRSCASRNRTSSRTGSTATFAISIRKASPCPARAAAFRGDDADGNVIGVGGSWARTGLPPALASATYDEANQLTSWNGIPVSYDANGNMTSDGTRAFTWDARNRLSAISGAASASFLYDGLGRRTQKTIGGQSISFLYDGLNTVQEQVSGAPSAHLLGGFGVDEVFARTDALGNPTTLLSDALGSTVALADSGGAVQTQYTYEPFGNTVVTGVPSDSTAQFTGRENDNTGLYYYRARYYSPTLQRFISEDPLGFGGADVNLHAYAFNSPTNFTDPSGQLLLWAPGMFPSCQHVQELRRKGKEPTFGDKFWCQLDLATALPGPTEMAAGSRALAKALTAAGEVRAAGTATHHVVAENARAAAAARAILARFGIGINEAPNGVFVPEAQHWSMHTKGYYDAVEDALAGAQTRQEALQILEAIRLRILAGKFP